MYSDILIHIWFIVFLKIETKKSNEIKIIIFSQFGINVKNEHINCIILFFIKQFILTLIYLIPMMNIHHYYLKIENNNNQGVVFAFIY